MFSLYMRLIVLITVSACTEEVPIVPEIRIVDGGTWTIDPDSVCAESDCELDRYTEIDDVSLVGNSIELISVEKETFTIKGLDLGGTRVLLSGQDREGEFLERELKVSVIALAEMNLRLHCDTSAPNQTPWLLAPESEVYIEWSLLDADSRDLFALPNFDFGQAEAIEIDQEGQSGILRMPKMPVAFEVVSELMENPLAHLEVHEPNFFDGFALDWADDLPLALNGVKRIETALMVDGFRVCLDEEEREAEITTPDTCSFSEEESVFSVSQQGPDIRVFGTSEGRCSVNLEVPAHGLSGSVEVEVDCCANQWPEWELKCLVLM